MLPSQHHTWLCLPPHGRWPLRRGGLSPGAAANCVHNSRVKSWEGLSDSNDEIVVIGGYESGMDATVHLSNAGVDVTVLASTPFWSMRTLDPSTELVSWPGRRCTYRQYVPYSVRKRYIFERSAETQSASAAREARPRGAYAT